MKKYSILRIEEPDFGCEGRVDKEPVKDRVYLEDENGQEVIVEAEDAWLYRMDINEGDQILYSEETGLQKEKMNEMDKKQIGRTSLEISSPPLYTN